MNTDKKRILVVDDQAANTRLLKLHLEKDNRYVVREENNPKAALSAAEEFQPHLILLDVMMPGVDGGEVAARIQAESQIERRADCVSDGGRHETRGGCGRRAAWGDFRFLPNRSFCRK